MEMLTDLVADDYVSDGQNGVTGFASNIESLRKGFPDIKFTLEDLIAEGDRVTARWQWKGTHDGTFRGIPATHKQVTNDGIVIYQLRDGKIIHSWLQTDRLGALQQIGVIPKDLGASVNRQH
ncbi:ester cyclase [bacterium]|nr:ester cyclase [bacterium]